MVHFKVISFCLVLYAVTGGSYAAPRPDATISESSLFTAEVQESIKQLSHEVEKSFKSFAKNLQFMFQNLDAIFRNTVETGFVNVATWAMDVMARFEFLIIADGSHFTTPVTTKSELEQEYKLVSVAVSKMLRNLKTMERTDKLITNATRKVITEDIEKQLKETKSPLEKTLRTILHSYIETMDHLFEADSELAIEYKKQKSEAKEHMQPDQKMHEPFYKLWEGTPKSHTPEQLKLFMKDKEVIREAYVNKIFMKHAVKNLKMIFNATHHHRFALARALIQKALSSGFDSKVNQIYHKALVVAGAYEYVDKEDDFLADLLFDSLEKFLESDRTLHKDIHDLMKQIEGSTIYDFDMFRIDFAPL